MRAIISVIKFALVLAAVFGISFLLAGRSSGEEPLVDKRLSPYFEEWKRDMRKAGLDYSVALSRVDRIEVCEDCKAGYSDRGDREIAVSREQLEIGPNSVRGTLYHELGHSIFNLQHESCNIMRSKCWTEEEYELYWPDFLVEYINECNNSWYESRF